MKEKIKKISFIVIFLYVFLFFGLVNAETSTIGQLELPNDFNFLEYFSDRQDDLAQLNRDYLIVALMTIFAFLSILGILLYFINIRPSQKRIEEQREELRLTKKDLEEKFLRLLQKQEKDLEISERKLEEKNKELKKEVKDQLTTELEKSKRIIETLKGEINENLSNLENISHSLEMKIEWNEHYVWEARGVYVNVLSCLIACLELGIKYKKPSLFNLYLKRINETITKIPPNLYDFEDHERLLRVLEKIEGSEKEKEEILSKAKKLIEESTKKA